MQAFGIAQPHSYRVLIDLAMQLVTCLYLCYCNWCTTGAVSGSDTAASATAAIAHDE